MLLATLVLALLLGWLAGKIEVAWKQQLAAEAILSLGGRVDYEYQRLSWTPVAGLPIPPREPPGPKWLRWLLGEHFFARAAVVVYPTGATDDDLKVLDDLPYITEIHLRCADVTGAGLNHVWKHEGLRSLGLRGVSVTDADVANLEALTQLESLELCHTPITDKAVETLRRLPHLESAQLEGTLVSHEAARCLPNQIYYGEEKTWGPARSEEQRQIAVALERDGARVSVRRPIDGTEPEYSVIWFQTSMDDQKLDLLERLEALRGLVLVRMPMDEQHWARVAGDDASVSAPMQATDLPSSSGKGLRRLETLILRDMPVTDEDMLHIKKLVNLKSLDLQNTQVTDAGLSHVASLRNLEELTLAGPSLKLRRLYIGESAVGITDAGLDHLAELPNLTHLLLYGRQISPAGVEQLKKMPNLESCIVNYTPIIGPPDDANPTE